MEIFLLLLDELDDAAAVLRIWLSRIAGFLLASGLFVLSILTVLRWPIVAVGLILAVLLLALMPLRRFTPLLRFKTDP